MRITIQSFGSCERQGRRSVDEEDVELEQVKVVVGTGRKKWFSLGREIELMTCRNGTNNGRFTAYGDIPEPRNFHPVIDNITGRKFPGIPAGAGKWRRIAALLLALCMLLFGTRALSADEALAIFDKRIKPILQAEKPSSCAECHLSGVDLKDFIRPTQQETFASLVAGGMIDVKRPEDSKLLKFIERKPEKPSLVSEQVRQEEAAAFRAWIGAAVKDSKLLSASKSGGENPLKVPVEVIRHARKDRVLTSFMENVWVEAGRCAACHSSDRNQEQVKKHGEKVNWMKPRDPQATLDYLLDAGLIDVETPNESLILLKPLLKVKHGGGQKMLVGDRSYKQFRRFLDDYAASAQGVYKVAKDLPEPDSEVGVMTEIWFKLTDVPAKYDQQLLQVDFYRWEGKDWSKYRVATSDRAVFGKGQLWQHSLELVAPRGSAWSKEIKQEKLPPGKYLAKIYVDQTGKLAKDDKANLDDSDLVTEVELTSNWPAGYGQMTTAKFPSQ